ncbi:MAG: hypothetical protein AAFY56_07205 [Pseudomonadota bacterium]
MTNSHVGTYGPVGVAGRSGVVIGSHALARMPSGGQLVTIQHRVDEAQSNAFGPAVQVTTELLPGNGVTDAALIDKMRREASDGFAHTYQWFGAEPRTSDPLQSFETMRGGSSAEEHDPWVVEATAQRKGAADDAESALETADNAAVVDPEGDHETDEILFEPPAVDRLNANEAYDRGNGQTVDLIDLRWSSATEA